MGNDDDRPQGTIIGSCSARPRLISDRPDPQGWESFARREPKPARERLGPLTFKPINHGPKP